VSESMPRRHNDGAVLSLDKTSSATKNGAILGSEGLNTISIASKEHGDFGRQDPRDPGTRGRVRRTYIYIRTGGKLVRTRQLDHNGGGGLPIAPEKGPDLRLPNEFCRSAFPSRVQDACGPHGSNEHTPRAIASDGVHSPRQCGPVGLVGSFRPNARPHRFARDSRRRYGQVLSSWIERPGEPPTRISHPGRRSETWAPTRMETPPVAAARSTGSSDGL
jgi:hypothetical protein